MAKSLSRGKALDVGEVGVAWEDLPPLGDSPEATRFDLRTLWPADRRDRPLEIEIGSGKGTFLVQEAPRRPDVNLLGVEYAKEFWRYAADRCRRHALGQQVRIVCGDARTLVEWHAADAVFAQAHIYFPDPWPKKRHHKRRLIQRRFLEQLHRTLTPGGHVRIVTDHDDYFAWIEREIEASADLFERVDFEKPRSGDAREVVGTNFERKYRREGRPFHALALRKD